MKSFLLNSIRLAAFSGMFSSLAPAAPDEVALDKCPTPVQKALREAGEVGKIAKIADKDGVVYEAEIKTAGGTTVDLIVSAEGAFIKKSEEVKLSACPDAVKKVLTDKSKGKTLGVVEMVTDGDGISYDAEIKSKDDRITQIEVGADGKILLTEEQISPTETPDVIKKVINGKVPGGTVEEVHKIKDVDGKLTYSARIITATKVAMFLEVDSAGKELDFGKADE